LSKIEVFAASLFDTGGKCAIAYGQFQTAIAAIFAARGGSTVRSPMRDFTTRRIHMTVDARRMGKSELFSHFAERFEVKRTQAREFFDELAQLAEKELKKSGEFVLPGMVKLVVQKRKARMGRNPATGEAIKIPAKTVVKARITKQLKDAVLPRK
jgi:DNA-binding protein HU-beta